MKNKIYRVAVVAVIGLAVAVLPLALSSIESRAGDKPSIKGTYRLEYRELPDGTKLQPPVLEGMLTFTREYRNFNIAWKDENGKMVSISYIAYYKFTGAEYSEESICYMMNDESSGEPMQYDLSGESASSPVTIDEGTYQFKLPLHDEPNVVFDRDGFKAFIEGEFTDFWKRVD